MPSPIDGLTPLYIATRPFGPAREDDWGAYVKWSGLAHLDELVSLDVDLCKWYPETIDDADWQNSAADVGFVEFFTSFDHLLSRVADIPEKNLLCVFLNPPQHPAAPVRDGGEFEFVGYDLVERATGISALTNCGGFRDVFDNAELTSKGLLANHARAAEVQKGLGANHPQEPHANCDLWAVFRWRGSKPSAH